MTRVLLALCLVVAPLAAIGACGPHPERVNAAATKPTSPANGAADYKDSPGGPAVAPTPPTVGTEPVPPTPVATPDDCPPKCSDDGSWIGCGLKKPRGTACKGCTPKCKGKGTLNEGWYDCNGVMIAERKCG
jgi:hypothetical protein